MTRKRIALLLLGLGLSGCFVPSEASYKSANSDQAQPPSPLATSTLIPQKPVIFNRAQGLYDHEIFVVFVYRESGILEKYYLPLEPFITTTNITQEVNSQVALNTQDVLVKFYRLATNERGVPSPGLSVNAPTSTATPEPRLFNMAQGLPAEEILVVFVSRGNGAFEKYLLPLAPILKTNTTPEIDKYILLGPQDRIVESYRLYTVPVPAVTLVHPPPPVDFTGDTMPPAEPTMATVQVVSPLPAILGTETIVPTPSPTLNWPPPPSADIRAYGIPMVIPRLVITKITDLAVNIPEHKRYFCIIKRKNGAYEKYILPVDSLEALPSAGNTREALFNLAMQDVVVECYPGQRAVPATPDYPKPTETHPG